MTAARTRGAVAAAALSVAMLASGCDFTGVNNIPLPIGPGSGSDALEITVEMASAGNLVPNSEVKVNELTVGQVRRIEFEDWTARITVGLDPDVDLPADIVARIGQKSLLGAQYLELAVPERRTAEAADVGPLEDGSIIEPQRTAVYPDTEQVLTAAGVLFSGGGLQNIAVINEELNNALGGREADWRSLLKELNTLVGSVNSQRHDLVRLIDRSGSLTRKLADQRRTIRRALRLIPEGLKVLDDLRPQAVEALTAVRRLSRDALPVLRGSRADLLSNLQNLSRTLNGLGDAGKDLPGALGLATFPLPVDAVPKVVRGDYANLYFNVDLTLETLDENFLTGTPLEGVLAGINGLAPSDTSLGTGDPLQDPLDQKPPAPAKDDPSPGQEEQATDSDLVDVLLELLLGRPGGTP